MHRQTQLVSPFIDEALEPLLQLASPFSGEQRLELSVLSGIGNVGKRVKWKEL